MAVGHHQCLQPHHLGTTSIPQCPCSWRADARVRPPELHPNSLQHPPQGSLCPPEEEDGQAQALSHPQGASGLRSRSGISAGSGRNVVAAGTMPAPCTGPLRDSTGAAAQAQPCSQGAGRKQMEMTPAAISCGRTRGLSPPPLPLPAQQGLGHHRHHCSGLPKPCAAQGTSTLLHPAPWPDRCHLHPSVVHATTRCRTGHCAGLPGVSTSGVHPGAQPAGTSAMGPSAPVPSCAQRVAGVAGGEPNPRLPPEWAWSSGQGSVVVQSCLRRGRRARRSPQALHNGGLFGTNGFPINYVI